MGGGGTWGMSAFKKGGKRGGQRWCGCVCLGWRGGGRTCAVMACEVPTAKALALLPCCLFSWQQYKKVQNFTVYSCSKLLCVIVPSYFLQQTALCNNPYRRISCRCATGCYSQP